MSATGTHIRVIFVVPNTCNSKHDLSPVMKETFAACKLDNIETVLVKENEDPQLETVKTDFIVFENFEGDLYKTVLRSKSVILSPLCLLHCVQFQTRIPNSEIPLVSLALVDCVVVCSSLPKESKKDLKYKVQSMSGVFSLQLVTSTTHLITNGVKSEKYNAAVKLGIKIMTVEFIDALWEASKTSGSVSASDEKYLMYKCPVFLNLNVCYTGFTRGESDIPTLVTTNGGFFSTSMDIRRTDILVCKGSSSLKYKTAIKYKIECVTEDWIYDSVRKGYALPNINDYAVKVTTSTPTKQNEFVEPNLSQISMISKQFSQTTFQQQIEETMDQSYFLSANANSTLVSGKRKSCGDGDDNDVIDTMDIKKAKLCGLYLDGCVVYIAGFKREHNDKLCKIINFSGAIRCDTLNETITHAIVANPKCHDIKQIQNKDLPCAVVTVNWLVDSMRDKKPLDVDNYLIASGHLQESPKCVSSSPMSKKGLNLLRSNVTLVEDVEDPPVKLPAEPEHNPDEDLMKHYMNSMNARNSVDDALAAFTLNPSIPQPSTSCNKSDTTITPMKNTMPTDRTVHNSSEASTCVTLEESAIPIFADLKFIIVNYSQDDEDYIVELIKERDGKIAPKNYKGIPDYAIVPIGNKSLQRNASNVVTHIWVNECCDQGRLIAEFEYYHHPFSYESNILDGLVLSLSGFNKGEKEFLSQVITLLGGKQQDSMSRVTNEAKKVLATTHLIAFEATGKKYQGAVKWGIPVVDKQWLFACRDEQRLMEEFDFLMGESKELKIKERCSTFNDKTLVGNKDSSNFKTPRKFSVGVEGISRIQHDRFMKQSPQPSKLDISAHKEVFTSTRMDNDIGTPEVLKNMLRETEAGCTTPRNVDCDGAASVHLTPANEIMKRVREMCGGMSTPRVYNPHSSLNDIKTPDSPLGICFEPNPSPETRKMWARWLSKLPTRERRLSTPFSEIKRRLWDKILSKSPSRQDDYENDFNAQNSPHENPRASSSKTTEIAGLNRKLSFEAGDPVNDNPGTPQPKTDTQDTNDHLLIERINELENFIMSSGDKRRLSSMKRLDNNPGGMVPDKESQPMTVGWDENMAVRCTGQQIGSNNKPKHFMLSGVDLNGRSSLIEKLEKLGATVSALSNYDPSSTHILCEKLNRNEKLLSSMASGLWILHISYVEDSVAAGKLLNEEDYEFGNDKTLRKFKLDADSLQRAKAAHYWRVEIDRRGYGAFHDIRAIVIATKREPMIRVLEAGGATIVEASPPFDENISATHCFLEVKNNDMKVFIPLAKQGILCVSTLYVNDFLQKAAQDINEYIVAGFHKYY